MPRTHREGCLARARLSQQETRAPIDNVYGLHSRLNELLGSMALKDAIQFLFSHIPSHLLPGGATHACRSTASVVLDKDCFALIASKMLKGAPTKSAACEFFRQLDRDSVGTLTVMEIVRRLTQNDQLPAVQPVGEGLPREYCPLVPQREVDRGLRWLRENAARGATNHEVTAGIVRAFERPTTRKDSKRFCIRSSTPAVTPPEFAKLLVDVLRVRVTREVSDAIFAKILGDRSVWALRSMSIDQFTKAIMPPSCGPQWWDTIRQKHSSSESSRGDKQNVFYDVVTPNAQYDDPSEHGRRHCVAMPQNPTITDDFRRVHGIDQIKHAVRHGLQVKGTYTSGQFNSITRLFIQANGGRGTVLSKDKFYVFVSQCLTIICNREEIDSWYDAMMAQQRKNGGSATGLESQSLSKSIFVDEDQQVFDPKFLVKAAAAACTSASDSKRHPAPPEKSRSVPLSRKKSSSRMICRAALGP